MKSRIIFILLVPAFLFSQEAVQFDNYFIDKTMRIDYFHVGDAKEEIITVDQIYEQGIWAGSRMHLVDPFNNGKYCVKVYDVASNRLIYSKGFGSYFGEYQTTDSAVRGVKRTYHESALIPYPKRPILFVLEGRDRTNIPHPIFTERIDPSSIQIIREKPPVDVHVYEVLKNGGPHQKVDFAWIGEGYTEEEFSKFKKDVDRYVNVLFSQEPYKSHKDRFNITGVFKPSAESGVDEPRQSVYRNTAVSASFNALNLDRYLLTEDNKAYRDIASRVPYDAIVILVNSERYGGGGIYNFYTVSTVDHALSENVFLHEMGHALVGLADEYYSSDVSYNEFYPKGVEPLEPNITALLDASNIKWKTLLSPGIDVPTDWGKEGVERLQAEMRKISQEMQKKVAQLKEDGAAEEALEKERASFGERSKIVGEELQRVRSDYAFLQGKVGVFEGAGYAAKGLYRPELNCMMFSNERKEFCRVCQDAIVRMIRHYSE